MSLALVLLLACSGSDDGTPIDTDTTDTEPPVPTADTAPEVPGPDMVLTDANNYTYDATWTVAELPIRASYDVVLSWSGLTQDAWGVAREASSYDRVLLLELAVQTAEAVERLENDDLNGPQVLSVWSADVAGRVFVNSSSLAYEATPFDPVAFLVDDPQKTWLLALADQAGERHDIRVAAILDPVPADPSTRAELIDTTSSLTWSATIDGEALRTAEEHELYTLDWRGLATDVHGKDYDKSLVDEMFMGRWDSASPSDLAADVHDLSASASAWWTMDIEDDDEARLELARDAGGTNFGGFTAGGTWLIGARCSTCFGPAPAWLTVVEVQ